MLSTDVAVPAPGTRRARRLAAAAAASPTPNVATSAVVAEISVPSPAVETIAPAVETPAPVAERPLTRRELRLAREAALAAESPTPTFEVATAAQLVASASGSAPARARVNAPVLEISLAPLTQARVAEVAAAPVPKAPLTRRALREAARAAATASTGSTGSTDDAPAENGFCADAAMLDRADVAHPVAERREVAEERELASVALTLSRLAVAATAFSAGVEPSPPAGEPIVEQVPAEGSPDVVAPTVEAESGAEGAAAHVENVLPLRRGRRRAESGMPPIPPGDGVEETFPLPEPVAPAAKTVPARHWVPRLAVLTALGAATVVTPVVAAASTATDLEPVAEPVPLAAESALETLAATTDTVAQATAEATAAEEQATEATGGAVIDAAQGTASLLAADQLAQVRETVASRSNERDGLPQCGVPDRAVPNGALAALESTEYVSLSMPLQEGVYRLTSQFGPRWGSVHTGTDLAAPAGTPIHAIADGEVIYAGGGKSGRSGMLVIIEHTVDGKKVESWYGHMYPDGVFVETGDKVKVGDVIGEVGSYGNSTGPHLHLEIHTGNLEDTMSSAIDSLPWLEANGATPITSSQVCA